MYRKLVTATVSGLLLGTSIPALAWAQTAAPASKVAAASLDEVIVTARRTRERLQDVPISVSVVSGAQLQSRGVAKLEDLQNSVAGVKIEPMNNKPSAPQIAIRGQRMYGLLSAQDSPTAFYFADAPALPVQGVNGSMYDLASIQVLKGPQGTLFGRNTTGGAVLVGPAPPTHDFDGQISALGGSFKNWRLQGFLNVPLGDTLAVRLAADFNGHDGYDTYKGGPLNGSKAYAERNRDIRLSVLWEPTDQLTNTAVAYYGHLYSTMIPVTIVAAGLNTFGGRLNGTGAYAGYPTLIEEVWNGQGDPRDQVHSGHPQSDDTQYFGLVNTTSMRVGGGITLKNIASYRDVRNFGYININGTTAPLVSTWQNAHYHTLSDELQASGSWWDNRVTGVAGVFYLREIAADEQHGLFGYAPPLPTALTPFLTRAINSSLAAYAQSTVKLTDKLALTGGVRITRDTRQIQWMHRVTDRWALVGVPFVPRCNMLDASGVVLPLSACSLSGKTHFSEPTYNLSLDYHITPDAMVYVTQRTGYRSGGFYQRAITAAQRIPFNPEKVTDREIGFKSTLALGDGVRTRFNIDYYNDKYKDLQKNLSQVINGFSVSSTYNAASGTVSGIEADFEVAIDRLTVGGNYAYTKTKYDTFSAFLSGAQRDFSDREFAGIPRRQASFYAKYDLPLDQDIGLVSLSANVGYQGGAFISETFQNKAQLATLFPTAAQLALIPDNTTRPFRARPYTLVHARIDWKGVYGHPIDIGVFVRNLTNANPEVYVQAAYETSGVAGVGIGPPRVFGAELTYHFH